MEFSTASTGLAVLLSSDRVSAHPRPTGVHRATRAEAVWRSHAQAPHAAVAHQTTAPAWPDRVPEVAISRSVHGHAPSALQPAARSIHIQCCRPPYAWEKAHRPAACTRFAAPAAYAARWTPHQPRSSNRIESALLPAIPARQDNATESFSPTQTARRESARAVGQAAT